MNISCCDLHDRILKKITFVQEKSTGRRMEAAMETRGAGQPSDLIPN